MAGRPSDVIRRRSAIGPNSAQVGASVGPLSWPRPRLRPGRGGARGKGVWVVSRGPFQAETVKSKSRVFFSFFWKIENVNWLKKKNRKSSFILWVKFKKLSKSFSAAKEKVYSQSFSSKCFIFWKLINGLKEIENTIFSVGKVQEKEKFFHS